MDDFLVKDFEIKSSFDLTPLFDRIQKINTNQVTEELRSAIKLFNRFKLNETSKW